MTTVATIKNRPSKHFLVLRTSMIVITVRLAYLNDYGCKEEYILQLSRPDVLMDENYLPVVATITFSSAKFIF